MSGAAGTLASLRFAFVDSIQAHLDWLGISFHGRDVLSPTPEIVNGVEYSETARAIHPDGLFEALVSFGERYQGKPIIVSDCGISDAADVLRPSFIVEHLLATREALRRGVQVEAFVYTSVSDGRE